ncbi:MAG: hypothetical protein JXJ17_08545 [Anaerolineae bacterium]|nr:hypothetical protein [Anaerolineae bacterium]
MIFERTAIRPLFAPLFGLRRLRGQYGYRWSELVDRVNDLPKTDPQVMAFRFTIDRIRRDLGFTLPTCTDRYCSTCISEIVEKYEGSEDDLLASYYANLDEVKTELQAMRERAARRRDVSITARRIV